MKRGELLPCRNFGLVSVAKPDIISFQDLKTNLFFERNQIMKKALVVLTVLLITAGFAAAKEAKTQDANTVQQQKAAVNAAKPVEKVIDLGSEVTLTLV